MAPAEDGLDCTGRAAGALTEGAETLGRGAENCGLGVDTDGRGALNPEEDPAPRE